jgi:hypothetical protein
LVHTKVPGKITQSFLDATGDLVAMARQESMEGCSAIPPSTWSIQFDLNEKKNSYNSMLSVFVIVMVVVLV